MKFLLILSFSNYAFLYYRFCWYQTFHLRYAGYTGKIWGTDRRNSSNRLSSPLSFLFLFPFFHLSISFYLLLFYDSSHSLSLSMTLNFRIKTIDRDRPHHYASWYAVQITSIHDLWSAHPLGVSRVIASNERAPETIFLHENASFQQHRNTWPFCRRCR